MFHHVSTFTQLGEINTHRFCTWKTRFNITFFARQLWLVLLLKIHGKNEHSTKLLSSVWHSTDKGSIGYTPQLCSKEITST